MVYLRQVNRVKRKDSSSYPFNIDSINNIEHIDFKAPVTFIIGENGCGKTTLLESIVALTNTIDVVPEKFRNTMGPNQLSKCFEAVYNKKTDRGFYLKSQSFVTFINYLDQMKNDASVSIDAFKETYKDRSKFAYEQVTGPYQKTLDALEARYGKGLDKMSHGEGYLELFKSRLVPRGLYILDEPELSLSPMRQLSLMMMIKDMVDQSCQFIIITHSPMLMAIEDAEILEFSDGSLTRVKYDDIEHVNLTRDFLNNPKRYLRYL